MGNAQCREGDSFCLECWIRESFKEGAFLCKDLSSNQGFPGRQGMAYWQRKQQMHRHEKVKGYGHVWETANMSGVVREKGREIQDLILKRSVMARL